MITLGRWIYGFFFCHDCDFHSFDIGDVKKGQAEQWKLLLVLVLSPPVTLRSLVVTYIAEVT